MEALFTREELNSQLQEKGYNTFDFLDGNDVAELLALYRENTQAEGLSGFHASMFHESKQYRRQMDEAIRALFNKKLLTVLNDKYHLLYANFMVKEPGAESEMPLHQDWSYVDESRHDSFAIWVPLLDLNQENGVFCVLPYSHKLRNIVRGPGIGDPFTENWQHIRDSLLKPVYLQAGQAITWHHRLAHHSPANNSNISRVAATAIIVPKAGKIYHFWRAGLEMPVEKYEVDHDFFMEYDISKRPSLDIVESVDYKNRPLTMEELNRMAKGEVITGDAAGQVNVKRPKRRLFLDGTMQSEFDESGYITLDLLDDAKFSELMELLDELKRSTNQENVNIQSEYELSFFNRDVKYRRKVLEEIFKFFKPLLDPILDGYEPLIVNLFNKKPGTGEVPIHQNWTFVDESKYTSVSVWIPLCDVSHKNGTLEIIPKSHDTITPYRSPSIPWVFNGLEEVMKEKYMKPLELKRGQIGILDDAILHYSSVNKSEADRGTIQLIMKPKEAMALHYYCEDLEKGELSVYKVDSDFFASFEMNDRPKEVPVVGKVHFTYQKINEDDLVERIS